MSRSYIQSHLSFHGKKTPETKAQSSEGGAALGGPVDLPVLSIQANRNKKIVL